MQPADAPAVFYLPGGKPEPGESLRQALARELDEELGVAPGGVRLLGSVEEVAVSGHVIPLLRGAGRLPG